jgi:uncharacterized protein (TIGR03437 family)
MGDSKGAHVKPSAIFLLLCIAASAAPNTGLTTLPHSVHRLARPQFDRGAVSPDTSLNDLILIAKPSAGQQAELNQLLADQQNPSSPQFRQWLTPEQFGSHFGLNASDHSRLIAWLNSEGFTIHASGRALNWIRFSGTVAQVQHALHTEIHRYQVNGETHIANATPLAMPSAFGEMVAGIAGIHDFTPKPNLRRAAPAFTSNSIHYLVPGDFATIYDVNPLYAAGIDGTGVNIGILGQSQVVLTDLQMFRTKYNLPANDPKTVLAGSDPGVNMSWLPETNLDVEWAGAIAPNATIYYYYSTSVITALISAINANAVHMISMSFGFSEIDDSPLTDQPILQQANAQGITLLAATGDYGAAQPPDSTLFSRFGPAASWPASYPEVTAVGGTQFNDASGNWWATSNDSNMASALSYIPEIAWGGGGGGASVVFPKPAWQNVPGVPADGARDLPDVSLSASTHDAYETIYMGGNFPVGGTSASTPSTAALLALLNHYLVANGQLAKPGLGNVNPQLYRLAQSAPNAFHDIIGGGDTVTCAPLSPGCTNGVIGYLAGPGYDLTTGIGSIDANNFITQWTTATNGVNVNFTISPVKGTLNDSFQLTAVVTPASGAGTPTGVVDFSNGSINLGSVTLDPSSGQPTANFTLRGYLLGSAATYTLTAQYRGDAAFSAGGASSKLQVTTPTGVAAVVPSAPVSVTATSDPTGLFWEFTMSLRDRGGVASVLTGVNLDGQDQTVSQFFPSPAIAANGSVTSRNIVFRNLAYPMVRTFIFSGIDATGQSWTRQVSITFLGPRTTIQAVILNAVPLIMQQNTTADPSCQWSQQLSLTDISGYPQTITGLLLGNLPISDRIAAIFGTTQLAAYGSVQGALCWANETPGATNTVSAVFSSGFTQDIAVSFAGPAVNPAAISVAPSTLTLATADSNTPAQATFNITVPDGQSWSIGVSPQNTATRWLSLSPTSGIGSAQITAIASGSTMERGAYLANLMIQGPNLSPAPVVLPLMFVYGDPTGISITGLVNAASGQSVAAPGMMATVNGTGLAVPGSPSSFFGFLSGSVPVTVNGIPAAFNKASNSQIQVQIPYETGTGPAVIGITTGGHTAGYLFNVTPSAPGLFQPAASVQAGKTLTLTMTGDGVTSPITTDGVAPSSATNLNAKPALPFTLTIGGQPAFLTSYGIATGNYSTTTLNVSIPASTPPGTLPAVVTVNGVSSPPVNVTVVAGP